MSSSRRPPWRTLVTAMIVVMGGAFHLGYHFTVINPSYRVFQRLINETMSHHYNWEVSETALNWIWSSTASILVLGEGIGCLSLIWISPKIGQTRGIALSNVILLCCTPLFVAAKGNLFELFALGRFIAGLALGMLMGFQDIGSPEYASLLNLMAPLMLNVGVTFAALVSGDGFLGTEANWQYLFYLLVPSLVVSLVYMLFIAHETPYNLLKHGNKSAAIESIRFYHGRKTDKEQSTYFDEINKDLKSNSKQMSLIEVLRLRPARKALFLSIGANVALTCSGILPILFYATELIEKSGIETALANWITIFVSSMTMWALIIASGQMHRIRRRTMLAGGCAVFAGCNFAIVGLLVPFKDNPKLWVGITFSVIMACFLFLIGLSLGNIALFLAMELCTSNYANIVSSIAISSQAFSGFILPFIFYPINDQIGAYSFLLFAIPMALFAVYFYFSLPETLNRPLTAVLLDLGANESDAVIISKYI